MKLKDNLVIEPVDNKVKKGNKNTSQPSSRVAKRQLRRKDSHMGINDTDSAHLKKERFTSQMQLEGLDADDDNRSSASRLQ